MVPPLLNLLILAFFVLAVATVSHGAKILCIFNMPSKSQYVLGHSLMEGLAERGHEVTMVSPFKLAKPIPNYKEIVLEGAVQHFKDQNPFGNNFFESRNIPIYKMIPKMLDMGFAMANFTMFYPEVQNLLKSGAKFDMLVSQLFLNEAILGLAHQFHAIPVAFNCHSTTKWSNELVGNPNNPAYNPNLYLPHTTKMNYWQRMLNTVVSVIEDICHTVNLRSQDALYKAAVKGLSKEPVPDLDVMLSNVSMVLLNTHVAVGYPRGNVPNMVDVAGLHIKEAGTLPKDLQEFLDGAKDGAIYFAMGGNLRSADIPVEKRDTLLKVFGKLKQRILWKFEEDNLPGQPKNMLIRSWMPQQDILAHPNIKCFITHGGGLSSIEAVNFGVPVIGIPIIGDQHVNVARAVRAGYAIRLNLDDVTEETLTNALNDMLNNPSYRQTVKTLSNIFRDEHQKPLAKAVHSVEYVLRHKGAHFLRSPSLGMSVIQTSLLDVWAGIFAIAAVLLSISYLVLRLICRKICTKKCSTSAKTAKKITAKIIK